VRSSEALIKANNPQTAIILEPPRLIKGSVTPVRGNTSVAPNTFKQVWNSSNPAAAHKLSGYLSEARKHGAGFIGNPKSKTEIKIKGCH